ncbi:hypothetical protein EDD18DRAFT_1114210 [Armillaria luteobubalina]|uniref:Uncharacterized protein n=1 Tax=Armillaria luteobubalina TaxID=153913 RepID=A0AA39TBI9_9AGAR|nr:hypothetical protein EDD18DRAFT_1114210 [Armillaria luteobubalina]
MDRMSQSARQYSDMRRRCSATPRSLLNEIKRRVFCPRWTTTAPNDGDDDDDYGDAYWMRRRRYAIRAILGWATNAGGDRRGWEEAGALRAGWPHEDEGTDGQRRRRRASPFGHRCSTQRRTERVQQLAHNPATPPAAGTSLPTRHQPPPPHPRRPRTSYSCISHYLSGGTRMCAPTGPARRATPVVARPPPISSPTGGLHPPNGRKTIAVDGGGLYLMNNTTRKSARLPHAARHPA